MVKTVLYVTALTTFVLAPAYAQGRGGGHAKTEHGPRTTMTTAGTGGAGKHATAHASTRTNPERPKHPTATTTTPTPAPAPAPPPTTSPIARKIESHPKLASRVQNMLPGGTTLASASTGFRNQGQFLAAVHVSQNLHIPFADLKKTMLGITTTTSGTTTTTPSMSLGQAIKTLRPATDASAASQRATAQATSDMIAPAGTTTTTAPASKKKNGRS